MHRLTTVHVGMTQRLWIDDLSQSVKGSRKSVVNQHERGKEYCCDASRPMADLWREIWALVEGAPALEGQPLTLRWVRGHTTPVQVAAGGEGVAGQSSRTCWRLQL